MVRSLWTAASGMMTQQINVDTIAHNFANVSTVGYKKETAEFQTLLYQNLNERSTTNQGKEKPIGIQVGLGSKVSAISSKFKQGNLLNTGADFDLAIQGEGFFNIRQDNGEIGYTREGSFSIMNYGYNRVALATSGGNLVLTREGEPIVIDTTKYELSNIKINSSGQLTYPDEKNNPRPIGYTIALSQFNNPAGLEKIGDNLYLVSAASGEPREEGVDLALTNSIIKQGYLEASNVEVGEEMVNLIAAQRAYELNSKAIIASDEMLSQANNLRR